MPNAVPLKDLQGVVTETLRQFTNGRIGANQLGIVTDVVDQKVDFTFNVVIPGGLNAIPRTDTTTVDGDEIQIAEDTGSNTTQNKGQEQTTRQDNIGAQSKTDYQTTSEQTSEQTYQDYGREIDTEITYDD